MLSLSLLLLNSADPSSPCSAMTCAYLALPIVGNAESDFRTTRNTTATRKHNWLLHSLVSQMCTYTLQAIPLEQFRLMRNVICWPCCKMDLLENMSCAGMDKAGKSSRVSLCLVHKPTAPALAGSQSRATSGRRLAAPQARLRQPSRLKACQLKLQ